MRSPSRSGSRKVRDAESELNLPPGFRFHPTDEELVVHYLCRKAAAGHRHHPATVGAPPPPPIIAEVDLYKHDPWELPELALFGTSEWYFFTPRDRKYPNGSRPNRSAGTGYWKATGADKPIRPKSDANTTLGIKKALVFYAGKGLKGIKTNWIMHEYRLATPNCSTSTASKLDDWVLCRLYNKKNNPDEKITSEGHYDRHHHQSVQGGNSNSNNNSLHDSFEESDVEFDGNSGVNDDVQGNDVMFLANFAPQTLTTTVKGSSVKMEDLMQGDDDEWINSLSLEDLKFYLETMPFDPNNGFFQMSMML